MVLIEHLVGAPGIDLARFGVDLFFVLSGLLMSRILFEQRTPIGVFYRRRIARILPAFLLFIGVTVVLFDAAGRVTTGKELLALVTFTRTYWPHPGIWASAAPVGHIWSLNVEEHCYILLAVIASIAVLYRRVTVVLLGLAGLTLIAVVLHFKLSHDPTAGYLLNTECAATGLLASAGYRSIACRWRAPEWASLAAILVALVCYIRSAPWWACVFVSPFLLAFSVNQIGFLRRPLQARWLGLLGLISYSVYLWQQPFYHYPLPYHLGLPLALACGAASFYFFESPIRRWLNSNWGPSVYAPAVSRR